MWQSRAVSQLWKAHILDVNILTMFGIYYGAFMISTVDEEVLWVGQLVGKQEKDAFNGSGSFVHNVTIEQVQVVGRWAAC